MSAYVHSLIQEEYTPKEETTHVTSWATVVSSMDNIGGVFRDGNNDHLAVFGASTLTV